MLTILALERKQKDHKTFFSQWKQDMRMSKEWSSVKCRLCEENTFLLEIVIIFLTEGAEITDIVEFLDCFRLVSAIVKYLSVSIRNV